MTTETKTETPKPGEPVHLWDPKERANWCGLAPAGPRSWVTRDETLTTCEACLGRLRNVRSRRAASIMEGE